MPPTDNESNNTKNVYIYGSYQERASTICLIPQVRKPLNTDDTT